MIAVKFYMKFGEKEHLEKMQKEGILYCNTITYFSKLEDNNNRGDKLESTFEFKYSENLILRFRPVNEPSTEWKKLKVTDMSFRKYYEEPLGNFFCISAFQRNATKDISIFNFDERFSNYKHVLIINNESQFMDRLKKSLAKLEFKTCFNKVQYLDLYKHTGKRSLFEKDIKYSWQEEFRILIYTNKHKENDPFEFSIGNIEDISTIYDLSKTKSLEYKLS